MTTHPVLCIPRVLSYIEKNQIKEIFQNLDLGEIEKIDIIKKNREKVDTFNCVFIHLNWGNSENATKALERLTNKQDIKIIYDEPWFWKVSAYKYQPRKNYKT